MDTYEHVDLLKSAHMVDKLYVCLVLTPKGESWVVRESMDRLPNLGGYFMNRASATQWARYMQGDKNALEGVALTTDKPVEPS